MTNSNGNRLDRIENAIERLIELHRNQFQINDAFQTQIAQLAERQAQTDEQIRLTNEQVRTTSAGLEQLERTVDYLLRRDRRDNGQS